MSAIQLALTYAPSVASPTTRDVSALIDQLESDYQAAALAPRLGHSGSRQVWRRATRSTERDLVADTNHLIAELEYLDRAIKREPEGPAAYGYDGAVRRILRALENLDDPSALARDVSPLEVVRMHLGSPFELVLKIPEAFVYVGGVSGLGAFLALVEKKANVIGRIRLERDELKLAREQVSFEQEKIEEERRAWRESLDQAAEEEDEATSQEMSFVELKAPFNLTHGLLDYLDVNPTETELNP